MRLPEGFVLESGQPKVPAGFALESPRPKLPEGFVLESQTPSDTPAMPRGFGVSLYGDAVSGKVTAEKPRPSVEQIIAENQGITFAPLVEGQTPDVQGAIKRMTEDRALALMNGAKPKGDIERQFAVEGPAQLFGAKDITETMAFKKLYADTARQIKSAGYNQASESPMRGPISQAGVSALRPIVSQIGGAKDYFGFGPDNPYSVASQHPVFGVNPKAGTATQVAAMVGETATPIVEAIGLSVLAGGAGAPGTVRSVVGAAPLFFQIRNDTKLRLMNQGLAEGEAAIWADRNAGLQTLIEMAGGSGAKYGGKWKDVAKQVLKVGAKEGWLEEAPQQVIEIWVRLANGEQMTGKQIASEIIQSGIIGSALGMGLDAGTMGLGKLANLISPAEAKAAGMTDEQMTAFFGRRAPVETTESLMGRLNKKQVPPSASPDVKQSEGRVAPALASSPSSEAGPASAEQVGPVLTSQPEQTPRPAEIVSLGLAEHDKSSSPKQTASILAKTAQEMGLEVGKVQVAGTGSSYFEVTKTTPEGDTESLTVRIATHEPNYALRRDSGLMVFVGKDGVAMYPGEGVENAMTRLREFAETDLPKSAKKLIDKQRPVGQTVFDAREAKKTEDAALAKRQTDRRNTEAAAMTPEQAAEMVRVQAEYDAGKIDWTTFVKQRRTASKAAGIQIADWNMFLDRIQKGEIPTSFNPPAPTEGRAAQKQPWEMTREEYVNDAIVGENERLKHRPEYQKSRSENVPHYQGLYAGIVAKAVKDGKDVSPAILEQFKGEKWADEAMAKGEARPLRAGEKGSIMRAAPQEWHDQSPVLYDWGKKGLRAQRGRKIAGVVEFAWTGNFTKVPKGVPKSTMQAIRAATEEVFEVKARKESDYYLVPTDVYTKLKSELPAEAWVKQPPKPRSAGQLINDAINSMLRDKRLTLKAIHDNILMVAKTHGIDYTNLSERAKRYVDEYRQTQTESVGQDISSGVEQAVPTDPDAIAEREAIQREEELTTEIGDFLDGLVDEQDIADESPSMPTGEQGDFLGRKDTRGGVKGYGSENTLVSQSDYEEIKARMEAEKGRALKRGKKGTAPGGTGITPQYLLDLAKIGTYHLEALVKQGKATFEAWASRMLKEFGESVRPHLPMVWKNIQADGKPHLSDTIVNIEQKESKKSKERGFVGSVNAAFPQTEAQGLYVPRSTDALAIKARNLIADDIEKAQQLAMTGTNDKAVATAAELIKHYNNKAAAETDPTIQSALYDKAAEIAQSIAERLTESGRMSQAAVILSRETPEGMLRFAAREIQKHNEKVERSWSGKAGLSKKIPNLTGEQTKYITEEMRTIQQMPEGMEKALRWQKLNRYIADLVPTPFFKKLITIWKAGLLTGIKTTGTNISANISHLGTETIKDLPATLVDKVRTLITGGPRAVTFNVRGLSEGARAGAQKGLQYLRTGYDERNIGAKLDYKRASMGTGKLAKATQVYTDGVFRLLGAEDQPFYYAAMMRSLYEQARVEAINNELRGTDAQTLINSLMANPTETMLEYAVKDAEMAVFQNQTALGKAARAIQKTGVGEIIVPFGRTPSAVAMQIVNYSPAGIAKTIIQNAGKGNFDRRLFAQGMGRGLTGTAVLAIGAVLYKMGMVALDRPRGEKEQKLWELEGRKPNSIKINGKWRSVQVLGPAGNLLLIGGQFKRAFEDSGSPSEAMSTALGGSAKAFTEQTFLTGAKSFLEAMTDPQRNAHYVAASLASSTIPTIIGDTARATDKDERISRTILDSIKAKIPGLRQTLEPRVDVLGRVLERQGNPLEVMADPTRPLKAKDDPITAELRRLWDAGYPVSPSLLGNKSGYDVLTPEENTRLWLDAGFKIRQLWPTDKNYHRLPDETKAKLIEKVVGLAHDKARAEAVLRKVQGLSGEALTAKLDELRDARLLTQDVAKMARLPHPGANRQVTNQPPRPPRR